VHGASAAVASSSEGDRAAMSVVEITPTGTKRSSNRLLRVEELGAVHDRHDDVEQVDRRTIVRHRSSAAEPANLAISKSYEPLVASARVTSSRRQ
jgi:hypothetical protein